MAISHKDIPDAELHDPKGFAGASPSSILKKNSVSSLVWEGITTEDLPVDILSADTIGRARMQDDYITNAKIDDNQVDKRTLAGSSVPLSILSTYNFSDTFTISTKTADLDIASEDLNSNAVTPYSFYIRVSSGTDNVSGAFLTKSGFDPIKLRIVRESDAGSIDVFVVTYNIRNQ